MLLTSEVIRLLEERVDRGMKLAELPIPQSEGSMLANVITNQLTMMAALSKILQNQRANGQE